MRKYKPPTTMPPTTIPPTTIPPTTMPPTTPPPVTAPPCQSKLFWLVEPGDTIYLVASQTNTTVTKLIQLNPHLNPNNLQPGDRICLP